MTQPRLPPLRWRLQPKMTMRKIPTSNEASLTTLPVLLAYNIVIYVAG